MKAAVFSLAALVFALGLSGTLGYGYGSSWGFDSDDGYGYGGYSGHSGYGQRGSIERTVHVPVPMAVPQPAPVPLPAYGAVGGSTGGGLFGEAGRKYILYFNLWIKGLYKDIINDI